MKYFKIALILLSVFIISCNSTNKSASNSVEIETQVESNKMVDAGFVKGTIVNSDKEGDCPFTIQFEGVDGISFYDPINITDDFKKDGEKIWFKFTGLRMMNRCDKANPIRLEEIQKRNE